MIIFPLINTTVQSLFINRTCYRFFKATSVSSISHLTHRVFREFKLIYYKSVLHVVSFLAQPDVLTNRALLAVKKCNLT